jgi:L-lactate permease
MGATPADGDATLLSLTAFNADPATPILLVLASLEVLLCCALVLASWASLWLAILALNLSGLDTLLPDAELPASLLRAAASIVFAVASIVFGGIIFARIERVCAPVRCLESKDKHWLWSRSLNSYRRRAPPGPY